MAERGFGVTRPNLPHWATAMGGWGVRSGRVFGWGVKSGLTGLNGGCQGVSFGLETRRCKTLHTSAIIFKNSDWTWASD